MIDLARTNGLPVHVLNTEEQPMVKKSSQTMRFCPQCQKEGKKSTIHSMGCSSTLLGGGGHFWDEEGREHYHDLNTVTEMFSCSNGHSWEEKRKNSCWCEKNNAPA